MNLIKAFAIATLLSITSLGVSAQEQVRHEYAVVVHVQGEKMLRVSMEGREYSIIPIDKDYKPTRSDLTPALTYISTMTEEGWSLYNNSSHSTGANNIEVYSFYLRRPKN